MQLFRHSKFISLALLLSVAFFDACRNAEPPVGPVKDAHAYNSKVYTTWNHIFMDADRYAKGYRPGPAPRALGYAGFAAYESVVSAIPENRSLAYQYAGLDIPQPEGDAEYHWPAVVNAVYAYMMPRFFTHMETEYAQLYQEIANTHDRLHKEFSVETSPEVMERSERYGQAVAKAVYGWSTTDAVGHNGFLNPQPSTYVPPTGPGLWQPTYPDFSRAVFPQWGNARTFALRNDEKLCRPPLSYSEHHQSLLYGQAAETFNTVNFIKENGSDPTATSNAGSLNSGAMIFYNSPFRRPPVWSPLPIRW